MDGGRDYGGSSGGGGSIFDTMGSGFQQKQQIPQLFQQQQQPTGILRNSNDGVVLLQPAGVSAFLINIYNELIQRPLSGWYSKDLIP